jgi:hypothetical protein
VWIRAEIKGLEGRRSTTTALRNRPLRVVKRAYSYARPYQRRREKKKRDKKRNGKNHKNGSQAKVKNGHGSEQCPPKSVKSTILKVFRLLYLYCNYLALPIYTPCNSGFWAASDNANKEWSLCFFLSSFFPFV